MIKCVLRLVVNVDQCSQYWSVGVASTSSPAYVLQTGFQNLVSLVKANIFVEFFFFFSLNVCGSSDSLKVKQRWRASVSTGQTGPGLFVHLSATSMCGQPGLFKTSSVDNSRVSMTTGMIDRQSVSVRWHQLSVSRTRTQTRSC